MARVMEGNYSGEGLRIGIVVSRFNEWVTKALLEGALSELRRAGVADTALTVTWVPGAYEVPLACQNLCRAEKFDALIAIACIIRGATSHYEHIAQSVCDGLQRVALELGIPIGLGVLTVEDMAQAMDRAGGKQGNKGRDAARSAIEMAQLLRTIEGSRERERAFKELISQEWSKKETN